MKYEFPEIINISQVLPHVKDRPEFVVAERDGFTVINYNVQMSDTFPPIGDSLTNKILRECRGITFCSETGDVLARKYHKFFNVNERDETLLENIDWNEPHTIMAKHDGSMCTPVMVNGALQWHTKMGNTDVAQPVYKFVEDHPAYEAFARLFFECNATPIFEWCSRQQKIVLDYPEDRLILTAIRNNITGKYFSYTFMKMIVRKAHDRVGWDIDLVESYNSNRPISEFLDMVRNDPNPIEGYVIRFDSGHMVKMKTDLYVKIHKAKEKILQERHVVGMILDNTLDDVKAHLPQEDKVKLESFVTIFTENVEDAVLDIDNKYRKVSHMTNKEFALEGSIGMVPETKAVIFRLLSEGSSVKTFDHVISTIIKNLGKNSNYEHIKSVWNL